MYIAEQKETDRQRERERERERERRRRRRRRSIARSGSRYHSIARTCIAECECEEGGTQLYHMDALSIQLSPSSSEGFTSSSALLVLLLVVSLSSLASSLLRVSR